MKHPKMKWQMWLVLAVLITGLVFFGSGQALAVNEICDSTTGTECVVNTVHTLSIAAGGSLTQDVDRDLHITSTGAIVVDVPDNGAVRTLNLNITNTGGGTGALIMGIGAKISGDAGGASIQNRLGATLNITAAGKVLLEGDGSTGAKISADSLVGNCNGGHGGIVNLISNLIPADPSEVTIDVQPGALISVNGIDVNPGAGGSPCPAGEIIIKGFTINIDGTVESAVATGLTGSGGRHDGGPITVDATCTLTISDAGKVSSRGQDQGADLVHLEACTVEIFGLVESTGAGHGIPSNPGPNRCDNTYRPDKPSNSTGCVEVWGNTITIDSTGTHKGEVNADIGIRGGAQGRGWIDIFAHKNIQINDGTGNDHTYNFGGGCTFNSTFAVHANGGLCQNTDNGGLITIKSTFGNVTAFGDAIQADAISAGGTGGEIYVEAHNNINFTNGSIFARGDSVATGGYGFGGKIGTSTAPIRAWNGSLTWTSGVGNVMPTGDGISSANRGVVFLQDCVAPAGVVHGDLDLMFPWIGTNRTTPTEKADACDPTKPVLPAYVTLPPEDCADLCECTKAIKRGMKFNDLNKNGIKDAGEPGLPGWTIHLFGNDIDGNPVDIETTTDAAGKYEFNVKPGTYTVCETQEVSWVQSFPTSGADCSAHGGGVGYSVDLACGQVDEDNDFGNYFVVECPEDPKANCSNTVDPSGTAHGGIPNYLTLQEAYDNASNGHTICMFGNTTENVLLNGDKTLKITQCTLARITAADNSLPVVDITSAGNLTIVSPDTVGGTIGWRIETDAHDLKSIRANNASEYGVLVLGANNRISWNNVGSNGVGIRVEGDFNDLRGGTVEKNSGDGVQFGPLANNNVLQGATIQFNGGNGVRVDGTLNTIKSNSRLNLNTLSGLAVSGPSNTIQSNTADQNGATGFTVSGPGNLLRDNKASKNSGLGFDVSGGTPALPNRLRGNVSNNGSSGGSSENVGFEFQLFEYVKNESGGNKADGVAIPKTTVPLKCSQFPVTNATKNFTAVYACGDGTD